MANDQRPRIRQAPIPDEAVLVVRGDELDPFVIQADATRFRRRFAEWGRYGISAFLAASDDEVDTLCQTKLSAWAVVVVFRRPVLEEAGIEVVPTFRVPHVTLAHIRLDALTQQLLSCDHVLVVNPYHERE